jgi:hypothetical protein
MNEKKFLNVYTKKTELSTGFTHKIGNFMTKCGEQKVMPLDFLKKLFKCGLST